MKVSAALGNDLEPRSLFEQEVILPEQFFSRRSALSGEELRLRNLWSGKFEQMIVLIFRDYPKLLDGSLRPTERASLRNTIRFVLPSGVNRPAIPSEEFTGLCDILEIDAGYVARLVRKWLQETRLLALQSARHGDKQPKRGSRQFHRIRFARR